jgi:hypothetical protein
MGIRFALDTPEPVRLNSCEYYLKGWFVPATNATEVQELALLVDGLTLPVYSGFARLDVGRHFNDPNLSDCGFVARFRTPKFDPNVRLIIRGEAQEKVLAHVQVAPILDRMNRNERRLKRVSSYAEWLSTCEPTLFWPEDEISHRLSALSYCPLISIILPTYNTDLYFLARCIDSVLEQQYTNWELCAVDDCSGEMRVVDYLKKIALEDSRVRVTVRPSQGGISMASNTALESARGEFIVLLDHDDELHPSALVEIAKYLNAHEHVDLIYSDEDKIDAYGQRSHPAFKPDFDMDMFLSFDYLGHLIALRRTVVSSLGGFRSVCDGAQDWDLLVRALEVIGPNAVHHIQKPLYHWRMHSDSTAFDLDAKPYARTAWIRVLSDHIERTGKQATVEPGLFYGSMRLKWRRPKDVRIAVILRTQDGALQTAVLEPYLERQRITVYEMTGCVVHRGRLRNATSSDSSVSSQSIHSLSDITEDVVIFINRPLETLNHFFFDELAAQAMREDCGVVTGISLDIDVRALHTGLIHDDAGELMDPFAGTSFPQSAYMGQLNVVRAVEAISDEFFAARRELLAGVGGLGSLSAGQMPRLASRLAKNAKDRSLRILVTPFAIATFEGASPRPPLERVESDSRSGVSLNSNFAAFENRDQMLRSHL